MKLTKILPGNKLTKLTNSLRRNSDTEHTRKQTHQTHKLTDNLDRNKLTKLTPKMKLTYFLAESRCRIEEIPHYMSYLFFSSEFVSLEWVVTCEEKIGGAYIQYRNRPRQTHQTHKLTLLQGAV